MQEVLNHKAVTLNGLEPWSVDVDQHLQLNEIRMEIECSPSLLNKNIDVTCYGESGQTSIWYLNLSALKRTVSNTIKLNNNSWKVKRIGITAYQEGSHPIDFSLFKVKNKS